jgi:hypothetical protein
MAKTKRTEANKSDPPIDVDFSAETLEPAFAVSDRKITVRRLGGKCVDLLVWQRILSYQWYSVCPQTTQTIPTTPE